ncbi:MAG: hypothetical protein BJ554DRAFT_6317 [Olpidium bornovanus]|uniref:Replication protein A C-terminal domain-containing protein n=1 Tax=Olpidium bornovanus TaxID=278681 RepID=A0A8H8DKT1_9FUNG|nr:MAG: hypothetical protein BJ554DRAFT_6317 [Olpidium bornovanus]
MGQRSGLANQSLRPVTIKQLTDASQMHPDAPFKIDDSDISQVRGWVQAPVTLRGVLLAPGDTFGHFMCKKKTARGFPTRKIGGTKLEVEIRVMHRQKAFFSLPSLTASVSRHFAVNEQATSVAYDVEDGTGAIEVRVWVEADEGNEFAAQRRAECCVEMWVRVVGQLRSFQNKRNVMGYSVRPIKDFNEITFHLLDISDSIYRFSFARREARISLGFSLSPFLSLSTLNVLYMCTPDFQSTNVTSGAVGYGQVGSGAAGGPTRGGQGMQDNPGQAGYGYGGGGGIGGQADYGGFGSDFSPIQQQVLQCVKQASHLNEGIHVNQLSMQLGPQFGQTNIQRAIEWLISEGHLYSTIDEDHVKCCADS